MLKRRVSSILRDVALFLFPMFVISKPEEYLKGNFSPNYDLSFFILTVPYCLIFINIITNRVSSVFHEWVIRKIEKDQGKECAVLHCTSFDDHNGALFLGHNLMKTIRHFSKTHSIIHRIVKNAREINASIDETSQRGHKITALWIHGHGSSECLYLTNGNGIKGEKANSHSEESIRDLYFAKLAPEADIVLKACDIGKENPDLMSFAEWVQIYAGPHRKVYAPKNKPLGDWTFYNPTLKKWTYYGFPSLKIPFTFNITANISYDESFKKAVRLGHSVGITNWARFLLHRISQAWNSFSAKTSIMAEQ